MTRFFSIAAIFLLLAFAAAFVATDRMRVGRPKAQFIEWDLTEGVKTPPDWTAYQRNLSIATGLAAYSGLGFAICLALAALSVVGRVAWCQLVKVGWARTAALRAGSLWLWLRKVPFWRRNIVP